MVLLVFTRDQVQGPCSGVLEKLTNKTPSGSMPVMLGDPAFFLGGRWGSNFFFFFAIHRKRCSLSTVDSCWELYTTLPAWQSPLSGLKAAASGDYRLLQASLCGFAEGGGGALTASRSSTLSEMWPLATAWISPSSALLPHVS